MGEALKEEDLSSLVAEAEPTEEEELADFEAEFSGGEKPTLVNKEEIEEDDEFLERENPKPNEQQDEIPAALKQLFDSMNQKIGSLEHGVKTAAGRVGALQSALDEAKKSTVQKGHDVPSNEQIEEALRDAKEWDTLKKDYPEWSDGIDKQFTVVEKRLMSKIPQIDQNKLKNDVLSEVTQSSRASFDELEERIVVRVKYPDYLTTINTPEFKEWFFDEGPTQEEYAEYKQFEQNSPDKAGEKLNELIRVYPHWWAERGSKAFSSSAKESIQLLDGYEAAKGNTGVASTDLPASSRHGNKSRLEAAVAPKTAGTKQRAPAKTEEDEFLEGFSSS